MSSRQEEKERRRREREELERKANRSAATRKRLVLVAAVVAGAAAIAIALVLALGSGGDDDGAVKGDSSEPPTFDVGNLQEAARLAKCTVKKERNEGADHTGETVKYQSNPPTSGDHDPVPAEEGEYEADNPPDVKQSVHSLEHGRINVQYKPGSPPERVEQLRGLMEEEVKGTKGYKTLLFQNQTGMTPAVAATAWTQSLKCAQWNDRVFDAIRAFRTQYVDKGPEFLP